MPEFAYKATDSMGKIVEGLMEAPEEREVISKLQSLGYIPIKIGHRSKARSFSLDIDLMAFFRRISSKDVMNFTQQLSTLLSAGLPLEKSLSIVAELTEKKEFQNVITEILSGIQEGIAFADVLAKHPKVFSKLYVSMVKAGEAGGVLEMILERLVDFLESSQELKDYITSAMLYPMLLTGVCGLTIILLLTFVIPNFSTMFEDVGGSIPASAQLLLGMSEVLKSYWWVMAGTIGGVYFGIKKYLATENGKFKWDEIKLKLIMVKTLVQKIEVSRFSRTLGTLIQSGVPILQSLNIVKETIGNLVIARSLTGIHEGIKEGEGISKPLKNAKTFPSLAIHMITVGEETGRLDEMLLKVADTYDQDVRNAIKRLISLLEPCLILFMALIVGSIVVTMLLAIISVNDISF
ncbi:MAG: type II secretion system F family protein [Deltaproteobacteria bacterium]|nr:type II secretion system F family protein [Deltaproteobacteria bacterium]